MRGLLGGAIWGLVFVFGGAVVLSLLYPIAPRPNVGDSAPQSTPIAPQAAQNTPEPGKGDADLVEVAPTAPGAVATSDDLSPLAGADTQPGQKPQIGQASTALDDPAKPADLPGVTPPQPGAEVPRPAPAPAPATPATADDPARIVTAPTQADGPDAAPQQPAMPQISAPDAETGALDAIQDDAPENGESDVDMAEDESDESTAAPVPDPAYQPRQPQMAELPQAGSEMQAVRPSIGTPARPLTDRTDAPSAEAATADTDAVGDTPLLRYAESVDVAADQPVMAIVLIDDAESIGAEALAGFPYPLSFAIDATAPEAAEKMARHRAAGFEVVAMFDLPAAATAQDAEVALADGFDRLDQTVALMEGPGSGIQGNRGLSDQVEAYLGATGRGLITQDKGLNTAQKLALRNGIPSAVVFRDFDGAGQNPTVMRRFLDQAAFRAGQDGAVIMLGRLRPDTISALMLWGLQDRAGRVTLVPVSTVLHRATAQ